MPDSLNRFFILKRLLIAAAALMAFLMASVIGSRIAVESLFRGIASSRATGLAAISPFSVGNADASDMRSWGSDWISKNAALQMRTPAFEASVQSLNRIVAAHHGYLEDLRTQSRSGDGRALSANVSVPSSDLESTLSDLKTLGRIEAIVESGEDSAVKIATASRHLAAAQTNLSRLQKLQGERKGELRDAVALEKDIAQANEALLEAERQHESLFSTVAQAHVRVTLVEDYRAPLQVSLAGSVLQIRNSLVEGVSAIFSSAALVLGVLLEFGLPLLFWSVVLFFPIRPAWRRFRRTPATAHAVQ